MAVSEIQGRACTLFRMSHMHALYVDDCRTDHDCVNTAQANRMTHVTICGFIYFVNDFGSRTRLDHVAANLVEGQKIVWPPFGRLFCVFCIYCIFCFW